MKVDIYATVTQKASPISNNNNQPDKYTALIEKLLQLGPNDWPKFQEHLQKTALRQNLSQNLK